MTVDKEVIRAWLKKNVAADQSMSMIEDPPPATRLELVRVWLEDNVFCPPTPKEITIYDINFDWENLSGTFRLSLDNLSIAQPFDVSIDIAGQVKYVPPMFFSPLGAPASYAAVDLDSPTTAATERALKLIFPRIRGYGLYESLGLEIYGDSPLEDRIIDLERFETQRVLIRTPGFRHTERVLDR